MVYDIGQPFTSPNIHVDEFKSTIQHHALFCCAGALKTLYSRSTTIRPGLSKYPASTSLCIYVRLRSTAPWHLM